MVSTRLVLRCDRCGHHHSHHSVDGCHVGKTHWEGGYLEYERCPCSWYVGELPPPVEKETGKCPHEIQVQIDPETCVYCHEKVTQKKLEL